MMAIVVVDSLVDTSSRWPDFSLRDDRTLATANLVCDRKN